jgi:hypothetical protein
MQRPGDAAATSVATRAGSIVKAVSYRMLGSSATVVVCSVLAHNLALSADLGFVVMGLRTKIGHSL